MIMTKIMLENMMNEFKKYIKENNCDNFENIENLSDEEIFDLFKRDNEIFLKNNSFFIAKITENKIILIKENTFDCFSISWFPIYCGKSKSHLSLKKSMELYIVNK